MGAKFRGRGTRSFVAAGKVRRWSVPGGEITLRGQLWLWAIRGRWGGGNENLPYLGEGSSPQMPPLLLDGQRGLASRAVGTRVWQGNRWALEGRRYSIKIEPCLEVLSRSSMTPLHGSALTNSWEKFKRKLEKREKIDQSWVPVPYFASHSPANLCWDSFLHRQSHELPTGKNRTSPGPFQLQLVMRVSPASMLNNGRDWRD